MVEQKVHFMINPKLFVTKILKWILQKRTKKERVLEKDNPNTLFLFPIIQVSYCHSPYLERLIQLLNF